MVRLLLGFVVRVRCSLRFQSHNGAIAACGSLQAEFGICATFNPTMVRLLLLSAEEVHVL